ncbi:MAG: hypothetical protein CW348_01750 [Thermobifida sp.]|nr:hypothetical protein [Thermobifida sp.]PZN61282.1 MAG: hypothetical protein DIU53_13410 [Thermobifida fusca]
MEANDACFPVGTILISPLHVRQRISESSPARATHGNTERYTTKCCRDCDSDSLNLTASTGREGCDLDGVSPSLRTATRCRSTCGG